MPMWSAAHIFESLNLQFKASHETCVSFFGPQHAFNKVFVPFGEKLLHTVSDDLLASRPPTVILSRLQLLLLLYAQPVTLQSNLVMILPPLLLKYLSEITVLV